MLADHAPLPAWLVALEARAPDLAAPFAAPAEGRPLEVRRGIRARAALSPARTSALPRTSAAPATREADRR